MWPNILSRNHNKRPLTRANCRTYLTVSPKGSAKPVDNDQQEDPSFVSLLPAVQHPHTTSPSPPIALSPPPPLILPQEQSFKLSEDKETESAEPCDRYIDNCEVAKYHCCSDDECCQQYVPGSRLSQNLDRLLRSSCSCRDHNCYDPLLSANPHNHSVCDHYSPAKVSPPDRAINNGGDNLDKNKENYSLVQQLSSHSGSPMMSHCGSSSSLQSIDIVRRIRELGLECNTSNPASPITTATKHLFHQTPQNVDANEDHDGDEGIFSILSSMSDHSLTDLSPGICSYPFHDDGSTQKVTSTGNSIDKNRIYDFKDDGDCYDEVVSTDNRISPTSDMESGFGNSENRDSVTMVGRQRRTYTRRSGSKLQSSNTNHRDKKRPQQGKHSRGQTVNQLNFICLPPLGPSSKRKRGDALFESDSISETRKRRKKTPEQLSQLETIFVSCGGCSITKQKRLDIARSLGLDPDEVRCWFKYKRSSVCKKRKEMTNLN